MARYTYPLTAPLNTSFTDGLAPTSHISTEQLTNWVQRMRRHELELRLFLLSLSSLRSSKKAPWYETLLSSLVAWHKANETRQFGPPHF